MNQRKLFVVLLVLAVASVALLAYVSGQVDQQFLNQL